MYNPETMEQRTYNLKLTVSPTWRFIPKTSVGPNVKFQEIVKRTKEAGFDLPPSPTLTSKSRAEKNQSRDKMHDCLLRIQIVRMNLQL